MRQLGTVISCLFLLVAGAYVSVDVAAAAHDRYAYKFPCYNPSACYVTQLAHVNNALDFDPLGSAGLGAIPAMAEGTVTSVNNSPTSCTGSGLGKTVIVAHIHGRTSTYAHLSSISVQPGTTVMQGDQIGIEGNTGNTYQCAPHLHWEPGGTLPTYIDNVAVSSLTLSNYQSSNTNSVVGEYSASGVTLRDYYIDHDSWDDIGWTHRHCPGACTLYMTANLSWGRMQDFRHHPDGFGGEFNTINVSEWTTYLAFLVDSAFWQAWAVGGAREGFPNHPISMAQQERTTPCPAGSDPTCIFYQRFHLGYVWMESAFAGTQGVFCPDVDLPLNGAVSLFDVGFVLLWVGDSTNHYPDINGNEATTLADVGEVLSEVGEYCRP